MENIIACIIGALIGGGFTFAYYGPAIRKLKREQIVITRSEEAPVESDRIVTQNAPRHQARVSTARTYTERIRGAEEK